MPCYRPVPCFRAQFPNAKGTRPLYASRRAAGRVSVVSFTRNCGYCIGCRLEKSRTKALRCMHEASLHARNCFITLTYNDDNLPSNRSISTDEMQRFWKRMRKRFFMSKFKYYAVGEYGENYGRPHYHACVFNFDFNDRVYSHHSGDFPLYTSSDLDRIWGNGHAWIGEVTFESAAYCARYQMKKVYGEDAAEHYAKLGIEPERSWSSVGLAKEWFNRYQGDVYPSDECIVRGVSCKPPPYYDYLLTKTNPELMAVIKREREKSRNLDGINLDVAFLDGIPMATSELVKRSHIRVGKLDNER